jgi:hypothetical protein
MSRALSTADVIENLQQVIHDLHDLSARTGKPFEGIRIEGLIFQYRDNPDPSFWTIVIHPSGADPDAAELEEAEEVEDDDEPDDLTEKFEEGFKEGRK